MQAKWKKAFLWSSVGGVAVGALATVLRTRNKSVAQPLHCRKIPVDCGRVVLWTERFRLEEQGTALTAHDVYVLEATPFKVWSVLDLATGGRPSEIEGGSIYHVVHSRVVDPLESRPLEQERLLARYYATVNLSDRDGIDYGRNRIARGGILRLAVCQVGGATNGIETGEVKTSTAPILNFRFESCAPQVHGSESPHLQI